MKYNTHEMFFSTTSGTPKLLVTPFTGEDAGSVVPGTPVEYEITTIQDYSPTYGIFQLKRVGTRIGDLDGKFLSVQVELGANADKAYITITDPPTDSEDPLDVEIAINKARTAMNIIFTPRFYNYHARETAPLTPTFARNIAGIRYMKSETTGGVPNGMYVPYNTEYVTFTGSPSLVMTVETVTPAGTTAERVAYAGKMKDDGGDFSGIFQLDLPSRPLHNKFVRVDVQEGDHEKDSIRITIDDDFDRLKNDAITPPIGNKNEFTIPETTHKDETKLNSERTALETMVAVSPDWASIDSVDKLYDFKNHQLLKFDLDEESINITTMVNGSEIRNESYTYLIMENHQVDADYGAVLLLRGPSTYNGQYLALTNELHTFPSDAGREPVQGTKFSFGISFNIAKNGLARQDAYLAPTNPLEDDLVKAAFYSLAMNTSTPPGFGTPSFVLLRDGAFDPRNTETWIFDPETTNVTITHMSGQIIYNLYMLEADPVMGTDPNITRETALFYLKSTSAGALYNNMYVHVRNHIMINPAGSEEAESTLNFVLNKNRTIAVNPDTAINLSMKDYRSASISVPAIDIASANTWLRLHNDEYQLDSSNTELWEFKIGGNPEIRVTDKTGTAYVYKFAPRESISSHRGIFSLRSTDTSAPYHEYMVGIGGEPTPVPPVVEPGYNRGNSFDSQSMRLVLLPIGASPSDTQNAIKDSLNNDLPEWNFRVRSAAELHFNPIMQAASIDDTKQGWVRLSKRGGSYEYVDMDTERWLFVPSLNNLQNTIAKGDIPASFVHDVLIEQSSAEPRERYGVKLMTSGVSSRSVEYQIFRTDGTRSNTFVILELGTGLDEKLMKVGIGNTRDEAKRDFDSVSGFNWSTYDRAVADWGPVGIIDESGKTWTLQRNNPDDIEQNAGSATTTTGDGHFPTDLAGNNKPSYNANNSIDFIFSATEQLMTVNYIVDSKTTPRLYSLLLIEEISPTEGVYIAQGGTGAFSSQFIYIEIAEEPMLGDPNRGKRGRMSIAGALTEAKAMNQALKDAGTWNFFESDWIRVSDSVFAEGNRRHTPTTTITDHQGAFVELGFEEDDKPNVYDPKLVVTYTFIPTRRTIDGISYQDRTVIISNVSPRKTRDDVYTYEIQAVKDERGKDLRSYALLTGTGPDGGKSVGLRLPENDTSPVATVALGTPAQVREIIKWDVDTIAPRPVARGVDTYRYSTLKSVESRSRALEQLAELNGMVTLDSDQVYVDNNTTEWNLTISEFGDQQAAVIERRPGAPEVSTVYKVMKVLSKDEDTGTGEIFKGVLFLKGMGTFDRNYIGVVVQMIDGVRSIKFYPFSSAATTPEDAFLKAQAVLNSTDPANFVEKSIVHFPSVVPIMNELMLKGAWVSLKSTSFEYLPENQITNIVFKTGQEIEIKVGTGTVATGRFKPVWDESSPSKTILQFVKKGTTALPLDFENSYVAVDLISTINSDGMKLIRRAGININDDTVRNQLISDRDVLIESTFIPRSLFDINTRSLKSMLDVSEKSWRQVINAQGSLAGDTHAAGSSAWKTIYDRDKTMAPWNYDLETYGNYYSVKVSRGTKDLAEDKNSLETFPYFVKMTTDGGAYDSVFRLYGTSVTGEPAPFYQSEISNQYHAMRVGTGADHFRMKITRGDTPDVARTTLNELPFFNMSAHELWIDTSTTWISNMNINAFNGDGETVLGHAWGEWVDMSDGTFDLNNHDLWSFVYDEGNESITYSPIRGGTANPNSYGLRLMKREGRGGFYTLNGFGMHDGLILAYQRGDLKAATEEEQNGASFFITTRENNTYEAAVAGLAAQLAKPGNEKYNWVERRTLRESIGVLELIVDNGLSSVISIDPDAYALVPSVNVVDKRNHRALGFNVNTIDVTATLNVVEMINGASTPTLYNAIPQKMSEATPDVITKGIILLNATAEASLHGKIFAVQVKATERMILFKEYPNLAEAQAVLMAGDIPKGADSIYLIRNSLVEDYSGALEVMDTEGPLVDLDQDSLYLDHETLEYAFDPAVGTVLISTRIYADGVTKTHNATYSFNEVKGLTPGTANRQALFFLKGTRGAENPLHNKFWAIQINASRPKDQIAKKVIITDDISKISDAILNGLPYHTAVKTAVAVSESRLADLENIIHPSIGYQGIGTLHSGANNFTYDPASTETILIDRRQRIIFYMDSKTGTGVKTSGTNYIRFSFTDLDPSTTLGDRTGRRLSLKFISNTRSDLFFKGDPSLPIYPSGTAQTAVKTP
ncbi:MAG: hypothetical protein ACRC4N_10300, partial [Gammaproteobacteria bacterium]